MSPKAHFVAASAAVGAASALAVAIVATAAQVAAGSGMSDALWFSRRLVLALGALALVIGGVGMGFPGMLSGGEDEAVSRTGLPWYLLVISSAAGALVAGTVFDAVVIARG